MSGFPSHLKSPEEKLANDGEWVKKYIKSIWNDFKSIYPTAFYNSRDRYHEIKLYMTGKQPINKYKKVLDPPRTANNDDSWLNISWDVLPIVNKYRRIALGNLNKSTYNVTAQAVDAMAQDDRDLYYADLATKILLKQEFEKAGLDPNLIDMEDQLPHNMEELEMHMKYSYKHQMAIEVETAIQLIFKQNDFDDRRREIIRDLFDYGVAAYKEYFDSNGQIKIRRVDPAAAVVGYSKKDDMSDAQYAGEIRFLDISDLKQEAGDQLNAEAYEQLEKKDSKQGRYQIRRNIGTYNEEWEDYKLQVLDIEFFSVNEFVTEHRVNSKGNKVVTRANYNKRKSRNPNKKYNRTSYKVVYKAKWVVGTDYFYDIGLATNMKRAQDNFTDTRLSYHFHAPDLYIGTSMSLGEQVIPVADAIQIAYYKLQNAMLRSKPSGTAINLDALDAINIGRGGTLDPTDVMNMHFQTGNFVYRDKGPDGQPIGTPFQELQNGLGREIFEYWSVIDRNIQLLRDILGFNEISDASTPDPRTGKAVAALSTAATNNALDFIRTADRSLTERLAFNLTLRIQDAARMGTLEGYTKALGKNSIEFFKVDPNISTRHIGVFLEDLPDDQEKERLEFDLQRAVEANQITIADRIFIKSIENVKMAAEVLAYRVDKNLERQRQEALEAQQMNAQVQQQSAQVAEQEKRTTMEAQFNLQAQMKQMEHQQNMELQALKNQGMIQAAQVSGGAKVTSTQIASESEEVQADIRTNDREDKVDRESEKVDQKSDS